MAEEIRSPTLLSPFADMVATYIYRNDIKCYVHFNNGAPTIPPALKTLLVHTPELFLLELLLALTFLSDD
jgi:hypothetical protein